MRTLPAILFVVCMAILGMVVMAEGLIPGNDPTTSAEASVASSCGTPITYRIGEVDGRFEIGEHDLRRALEEAIAMWDEAIDIDLFSYAPDGEMTVNLIYDDAQQTWEAQRAARRAADEAQRQYEQAADELAQAKRAYESSEAATEAASRQLDREVQELNREISAWNAATQPRTDEERMRLEEVQRDLERKQRQVGQKWEELEAMRARINQRVNRVNQLARQAERQADAYNRQFGDFSGFNKGEYAHRGEEKSITIYQFEGHVDLRQVLAHELGHALGLGHVEPPSAIMHYRMNEQNRTRGTLSAVDRSALIETCGA